MKKQGYNARLDDALGSRHGKKKQSYKARRHESEGMEKHYRMKGVTHGHDAPYIERHHKYAGDKEMY